MEFTVGSCIAGYTAANYLPRRNETPNPDQNLRIRYLAQAILEAHTNLLDGIAGLWAIVLTCLTAGQWAVVKEMPCSYIPRLNFILPKTFYYLLLSLNPDAKFACPRIANCAKDELNFPYDNHSLCDSIFKFINHERFVTKFTTAPDFLTQHVISRIAVLGFTGVMGFAVATDHLIALTTAFLAIISFGKFPSLNGIAYQYLKSPIELCSSIILFIAFLSPSTLELPEKT